MPDDAERFHAESAREWDDWLARHHGRSAGVWLVTWKASTGRPRPDYDEVVSEALRFGWVDSKVRRLDDERTMLWVSPRRPGSGWSRSNKERVDRLEAAGRMAPAGARVVAQARASGAWNRLDEVEALVVPDDLATAFDRLPGARTHWDAFPRSTRRATLEWITQAKRADTRRRRVTETAERAARGERPR
ncbi:YdeI/OmpD-associated family protein [Micromonospora sp. RTP1Z1]|uniref:YdeI/OmpD-associated family protein n=1 Tax=Micromonospora sp. RTP1Z1 TaxID=2994043 RepID=UPI0029C771E9|nr:YdeI/OmpD-associated family protein [Micromonospora sp. RTP1Z1]